MLAALGDGVPSVCQELPQAEPDEAVFPASRTVAWLQVQARPWQARSARLVEPRMEPVAEAVFYNEPGEMRLAPAARGTEWAEDYWENLGEYVSLAVTARY